jgi:Holliday junction DNA helicase RuvB
MGIILLMGAGFAKAAGSPLADEIFGQAPLGGSHERDNQVNLVRAKKGRGLDVTVAIKVVAATNQVSKLSPELKSRFAIRKLKSYDAAQYQTIVKGVLVRREGINPELAEEIARKLEGNSQDVRDAVRVARLSPQLGVDKAIHLLLIQ